jgi:hypothetical protein
MEMARNRIWSLGRSSSQFVLVVSGALLLMLSSAHAATLNVVGGQLVGASGVDVGGLLYDVQFGDGTCIGLYTGCDSPADFTFNSLATATQASQALLDQVLLNGPAGPFDSTPDATLGCDYYQFCWVSTAYGRSGPNALVSYARNIQYALPETTGSASWGAGENTAGIAYDYVTYAVWTPVPEPGTALLMGLGLLAMGVGARRNP